MGAAGGTLRCEMCGKRGREERRGERCLCRLFEDLDGCCKDHGMYALCSEKKPFLSTPLCNRYWILRLVIIELLFTPSIVVA